MSRFDSAKRVMSGTWGEVWWDGDLVSEADKFTAKYTFNKQEIGRNGEMAVDYKTTSTKGAGSLRMHKVNSRVVHKVGDAIRNGRDVRFTFIGKLDDPDAYGAERVRLINVSLDELPLMDWENSQPGKLEIPFTFTDHEMLDSVDSIYE